MRKTSLHAAALMLVIASVVLSACKTNENNYRQAYERATAANDRNVTDFENTIYSKYRNQVNEVPVRLDDGSVVNAKNIRVVVTKEGGGLPEWLKKYSVVAAEFKQRFNANSFRKRFVEAGYPRAFLVENAEPYYYVIVGSSDNPQEMRNLADSLVISSPIPLKEGFPYLLVR